MGATECKPCSQADPTADTVKVDQTLLAGSAALPGKEEAGAKELEAREQKIAEEEAARAEQERQQRVAEEAAAEDQRQKEAEAQLRQQEADAERQRQDEEAAAAQEAAAASQEEERARAEKEQSEAKKTVDAFLRARGFKDISTPKKKCFKTSYPLHVAVEENSAETVRALLLCGADASKKNSAGKTPREVALNLNKKGGSRTAVLAALPQ